MIAPRRARAAWDRFRRNPLTLVGAAILVLEVVIAAIGPALLGRDPALQGGVALAGPSARFLLGTDDLGRDLLVRIVNGTGLALIEGVSVVLISMGIGVPLGALAAYDRRFDDLIMRPTEVMLSVPGLLLAFGLVPLLGANLVTAIVAASVSAAPGTVVLTRALVAAIVPAEYVLAARAVGCPSGRILFWHVLPNTSSSLAVAATFRAGLGILFVSALSFLGLGAQPPTPEWGAMLSSGRDLLYSAPHVATFPGIALGLTILAFNMLGDGLRDVLDPRTMAR